MILYTQYNDEEWYGRIDPEYDEGSPVAMKISIDLKHIRKERKTAMSILL